MGSSPSNNAKLKSTHTGSPSPTAQNPTTHNKRTLPDIIHGEILGSIGRMSTQEVNNTSFPRNGTNGRNQTATDSQQGVPYVGNKSQGQIETAGVYKSKIPVTKGVSSSDINLQLQNKRQNTKIKTSPKHPHRNVYLIEQLTTSLRKCNASNLHERESLMKWLGTTVDRLNIEAKPDYMNTSAAAQDDDFESREQNDTGEHWEKVKKETEDLKSEKQQLLYVVSEIAGNRLKNNNPAIADLSDKNRASKLAERFSELYDNEWTDVVEVLRTTPKRKRETKAEEDKLEEESINYMREFVKTTYEICQKKAKEDLEKMQHIVVKSTTATPDVVKRCTDFMKSHMSASVKSLDCVVRDIRPKVEKAIEEMEQFSNFNKTLKGNAHYNSYSRSCMELCWYMCLQDPPVAMMATISDKACKDHFRAYTRSGTNLRFIVWPALFLYEGGPLLYKGVAQYSDTPRKVEQEKKKKIN